MKTISTLLASILILSSCSQNKNKNQSMTDNYETLALNKIETLTIDNSG